MRPTRDVERSWDWNLGEAEVDWLAVWIRPSPTASSSAWGSGAEGGGRPPDCKFASVSETVQHGTGGPTAILTPRTQAGDG